MNGEIYDMKDGIRTIWAKLDNLYQMIDEVLKDWGPYKEDCDSDWVGEVEKLRVIKGSTLTSKIITDYEVKKGFPLPVPYIEFLKTIGTFEVGPEITELIIHSPGRQLLSLGKFMELNVQDDRLFSLGNFKDGHYHDFIVICEYGQFPYQNEDYSSVLAFNQKNPQEIIVSECDGIWLPPTFEERESGSANDVFLSFIEDKIDRLIKRADEPVGGLRWEIDYYKNSDE